MTKETLKAFLDKSGLQLSYVAKQTGICRTTLSYYVNGYEGRSFKNEYKQRVADFIEEYKLRWRE